MNSARLLRHINQRTRLFRALCLIGLCVALISACQTLPDTIPTLSSIPMAQTAAVLTQNAPPTAYRSAIEFPLLDARLTRLPSWYSVVAVLFDGIVTTDKSRTTAQIEAQIYRNELASTRRVLFSARGEAFGVKDSRSFEAVRIANDYYWVLQNPAACAVLKDTDTARRQIADYTAGALLGGIKLALPTGQKAVINNQNAWEYAFAPDSLTLPIIHTDNVGTYTIAAGSLWVAPESDAVVRFSLTVNVDNVRLLEGEVPVTGQLRATYELKEINVPYNITVPFGC